MCIVGMQNKAGSNQTVYFDRETLRRVDAHAHKLQAREAGVRITRSAAVRNLVLRGLDANGDGFDGNGAAE